MYWVLLSLIVLLFYGVNMVDFCEINATNKRLMEMICCLGRYTGFSGKTVLTSDVDLVYCKQEMLLESFDQ